MKIMYWAVLVSTKVFKKIVFVIGFAIGVVFGLCMKIDNGIHIGFNKVIEACESELGIKNDEEIDPEWEIRR